MTETIPYEDLQLSIYHNLQDRYEAAIAKHGFDYIFWQEARLKALARNVSPTHNQIILDFLVDVAVDLDNPHDKSEYGGYLTGRKLENSVYTLPSILADSSENITTLKECLASADADMKPLNEALDFLHEMLVAEFDNGKPSPEKQFGFLRHLANRDAEKQTAQPSR
jgi:hypothetical protein